MDRRKFIRRASMGTAILAIASTIELEGCSISSVFTDIANWVPVGEASLNSILAVLSSNGVPVPPGAQLIVNDIEAAFAAVLAAIKEYQSTTPAPVGALAKIQTALKAVVDQTTAFLAALVLPAGNILTLISSLAGIIFSTIAAFANQLPLSSGSVMASVHQFRLNGQEYKVVSVHRTRRGFKRDWNSALDRASINGVDVPQAARMHLTFWEHL